MAQTQVYGLAPVDQKLVKPLAKIQKSFWGTVWLAASVLCLPTGFPTSLTSKVSAPKPVDAGQQLQFQHDCATVPVEQWGGCDDLDPFWDDKVTGNYCIVTIVC